MQEHERRFLMQRTEWRQAAEQIPIPLIRACMDYTDVEQAMEILGDCRCGSTSLAIVLARLGFPVGYQEDKAALRSILAGLEPEQIHFGTWGKKVVSKSTIGGGQLADCLLNPLDVRLYGEDGFGIPADKLSSILMMRNTLSAYESWKRTYSNDFYKKSEATVLENFLAAQYTLGVAQADLQELQDQGSPVTFFAQELLNYRGSHTGELKQQASLDHVAQVVHTIMSRSNMPVEMDAVYKAISNWPRVTAEEAHKILYFPKEPPYDFNGAILPTFNSGNYSGRDPSMPQVLKRLTINEIRTVFNHGLTDLYNEQLHVSIDHLGLDYNEYEGLAIQTLNEILTLRESTI